MIKKLFCTHLNKQQPVNTFFICHICFYSNCPCILASYIHEGRRSLGMVYSLENKEPLSPSAVSEVSLNELRQEETMRGVTGVRQETEDARLEISGPLMNSRRCL